MTTFIDHNNDVKIIIKVKTSVTKSRESIKGNLLFTKEVVN